MGKITEWGRGFVKQIKFGAKSLSLLLEAIEVCCDNSEKLKCKRCGQKEEDVSFWNLGEIQ